MLTSPDIQACFQSQRSGCHLVRKSSGLTDNPQRQRLFVTQSLQVAADSRPLNLPLTQVICKPEQQNLFFRLMGLMGDDMTQMSAYLRLKASRCVLSMSSPLSILVRLDWAYFSRLAEAISRLSIHFLINSCSFSNPVFPAIQRGTRRCINLLSQRSGWQQKMSTHVFICNK